MHDKYSLIVITFEIDITRTSPYGTIMHLKYAFIDLLPV